MLPDLAHKHLSLSHVLSPSASYEDKHCMVSRDIHVLLTRTSE